MRLSRRLDKLAPYPFVEITRKIAEKRAAGVDVVTFAIGDPDIPTPKHIMDYSPPQLLLFMLVRQYRQLLLVQALLGEGRSRAQVGAELGINHPFVLDKVMGQVGQLGPAALEASYRRLFETDVAVKTGVLEAPVALELLIVELASLVTAPRRAVRRS